MGKYVKVFEVDFFSFKFHFWVAAGNGE
jgi:hypothetical protein